MKRSDIIFLLTSIVILTVAWAIFSIIHASITSTISNDVAIQIEPIAATFDAKTIATLHARQVITPAFSITNTSSISGASIVKAIPTITPLPTIPTYLPIASPTNVATQGGTQL